MKAKVLLNFTDKHTGKKHKKGDVIEVTATRFNEILSKGKYVEAADDAPVKTEKK